MNPLDSYIQAQFWEQGRFRWNNYLFQVPRPSFFLRGEVFFLGGG